MPRRDGPASERFPSAQAPLERFGFAALETRTMADRSSGSGTQINVSPGSAPKMAATASGMVARTLGDAATVFRTLDLNSRMGSPLTATAGRLFDFGLYVALPVRRPLDLYPQYDICQYMGQPTLETTPHPWTDQRAPALAIVARGDQIRARSATEYLVRSQTNPSDSYIVLQENGFWSCTCQHHRDAKRDCIHILAVKFRLDFQRAAPTPTDSTPPCPKCPGKVIGHGCRYNKNGKVRRWLCRGCGQKFTGPDGFRRRRTSVDIIANAMDLFFRGMSTRDVSRHILHAHGLPVSHMTVYRWVVTYGRMVAKWMDQQAPSVGITWHVDETVIKVNGEARYLWNVMDRETRFALATHVSDNRSLANTRTPLRKAKAATPNRPCEVRTDGMMAYPEAVSKELGRKGAGGDKRNWVSPHRRVPSIRAKESNNRIERLHGTEKQRTKVMRGFDTDAGSSAIMEAFRAHYNLVRPHEGLDGRTPADVAGINPLGRPLSWKDLLALISREPSPTVSQT